jgi:hypothetical protein
MVELTGVLQDDGRQRHDLPSTVREVLRDLLDRALAENR